MTALNDTLLRSDTPRRFGSLRLCCREVSHEDAAFYVRLLGMAELNKHRPGGQPRPPELCRQMLDFDLKHWRDHGFGRFRLLHAGQEIGLGGLVHRAGFDGLNLSYHLLPDWWGMGLASEFVRAALDFGRDELAAKSVYGLVRPTNIASIRVLEKAGFRDANLHIVNGGPMRELRLKLR